LNITGNFSSRNVAKLSLRRRKSDVFDLSEDMNMKKEELKDIMEDMLGTAKTMLEKDGKLRPIAFMKHNDNFDMIPLSFSDNDEKNRQLSALRILVKKENADAVFVITESWYVSTNNVPLAMEPSKDPTRKECIIMIGECGEGNITIIQLFDREGGKENGKIIFGQKLDREDAISTKFNFGIKDRKRQDKRLRNLS
jgi:hypothetical protein